MKKRNSKITQNLREIIKSDSFKVYEEDQRKYLEGWQFFEPADLSPENRYASDKEAYVNTYYKTKHLHGLPFDENMLLEKLISNLRKAKHPVFIEYRKYLKRMLKGGEVAGMNGNYNTQIFRNEKGHKFFELLIEEFKEELDRFALSHLSFIYWKIKNDKYLHDVSPLVFRNFLREAPHFIELDKIKTLASCTTKSKVARYTACKKSFST
ncbi:MAG: hypothetical protein ACXVPN_01725 [Bacteroidia bacterium]